MRLCHSYKGEITYIDNKQRERTKIVFFVRTRMILLINVGIYLYHESLFPRSNFFMFVIFICLTQSFNPLCQTRRTSLELCRGAVE
jgi:hypothetical protein